MSKIYDKYLTIDQQKGIKAIPDERRWNNYRNFDLELEVWDTFWNNTFKWTGEQKPKVLDYGCGAAYDEVVASKLGIAEVTSLDINTKEVKIVFGRFRISTESWKFLGLTTTVIFAILSVLFKSTKSLPEISPTIVKL